MKRPGFKRPEWKPGTPTSTLKRAPFKRRALYRAAPYPAAWPSNSSRSSGSPVEDNRDPSASCSHRRAATPSNPKGRPAGNVTTPQRDPENVSASRARASGLKRSWMRRRPTRVKDGHEPKYRTFVRGIACAVCQMRAPSQFCHERVKGTGLGLKGPDARGWPGCARHNFEYDERCGFFEGWSNERRAAWVTAVTVPLRAAYLRLYGAEPELRERIAG